MRRLPGEGNLSATPSTLSLEGEGGELGSAIARLSEPGEGFFAEMNPSPE